jgi:DegV family protein with EDD domain
MREYIIMTDSCCDLPREYIETKQIPFVSLSCNFGDKEYKDDFGQGLSYRKFYEGMKKGEMPKTSQPNPENFFEVFKEITDQGKDIIYICVSSGLSGTFNSSNIAREMILEHYREANIVIVDVLTASLGQGLMVMKAVEMKEGGSSFDDVVNYLETNKLRLNTYITVDDLNHLKRGGRISTTSAMIGIMLQVKPVLTLTNEGKVIPVLKVKGRKNAINKLAQFVCDKIEHPQDQIITISHGDAHLEAEKLKELILSEVKVKDVIIHYIGPVVGTYGGPGALAVFFMGKPRQNHIIEIGR